MGGLREKTGGLFDKGSPLWSKNPRVSGRMRGEGAEKGFFAHRVWQNAAECLYLRPNSIVYAAVSTLFIFPNFASVALFAAPQVRAASAEVAEGPSEQMMTATQAEVNITLRGNQLRVTNANGLTVRSTTSRV